MKRYCDYRPLWNAILEAARRLELDDFKASYGDKPSTTFVQLYSRESEQSAVHYEWLVRKEERLDVALHVEFSSQSASLGFIRPLLTKQATIRDGIPYDFECGEYGMNWAQARFSLPYRHVQGNESSIAGIAADTMEKLVHRTWPLIRCGLGVK